MSFPKGTRLGGIRTVEDLKLRSVVDEDTGCWHWSMAMFAGAPRVHAWLPDTGREVTMRGRRAALYLEQGHDIPAKHIAYARHCCKSDDCVNPAHSRSGTKAQWGKWLTKTGKTKNLPSKCVAARKGWDKRGRKLTPEDVADIRSSKDSIVKTARRLGVSTGAVSSVLQQLSHRPLMAGASVFTWGVAAA